VGRANSVNISWTRELAELMAALLPGQRLHQQIGLEADEGSERIKAV